MNKKAAVVSIIGVYGVGVSIFMGANPGRILHAMETARTVLGGFVALFGMFV